MDRVAWGVNEATVTYRREAQKEEAARMQALLSPFSGNSEQYRESLWKVIDNRHEMFQLFSPYLKRGGETSADT